MSDESTESLPWEYIGALRVARAAGRAAAELEEQTLISGAMPGEFGIVHIFRVGAPWGTELR